MWRDPWGHAGFSFPEGWTQLPRSRFPSGDRRCSVLWLRDYMWDHMFVLENRPLGIVRAWLARGSHFVVKLD